MAEVRITTEAQAQLDRLPHTISLRVLKIVERLGKWPAVSGAKPLRGELVGYFRIRTGDWRVIVRPSADDREVTIVKVDNRRDVYED